MKQMKHRTEAAAPAQPHVLCLLASNGDGACNAAFGFPVAMPATVANFNSSPTKADTVEAELVLYANPSQTTSSLPPKA